MGESVTPSRPQESRTKSNRRKAIRGLRQRRAYYRCCIPALAGFVSLRSIAPDGSIQMDQLGQNGNVFLTVNRIGMVFKFLLSGLEKSQIPVCDFSASLQIGLGCRFAEAAGAGLAPQVRHMVRIAHEGP